MPREGPECSNTVETVDNPAPTVGSTHKCNRKCGMKSENKPIRWETAGFLFLIVFRKFVIKYLYNCDETLYFF